MCAHIDQVSCYRIVTHIVSLYFKLMVGVNFKGPGSSVFLNLAGNSV